MEFTNELFDETLRKTINRFQKMIERGMTIYTGIIQDEKKGEFKDKHLIEHLNELTSQKRLPVIANRVLDSVVYRSNERVRNMTTLHSTYWLYMIMADYIKEMISYLNKVDEDFLIENSTSIEIMSNTVEIQISVLNSLFVLSDSRYDEWIIHEDNLDYIISGIKRGIFNPNNIQ